MTTDKQDIMEVQLRWEGAIAVLTINNPSRRNALSDSVNSDLLRHMSDLTADRKCRAIVLTGAGNLFCAGGDVKAMMARAAPDIGVIPRRLRFASVYHPILRLMVEGPKPLVSAVEGVAYGGGLAFAVAADYTVAASNTRFSAAQVLRGVCPDVGLYYVLTARTGPGRARELLLSGREFNAVDGEKYGVVHERVEPGKALEAAMKAAERFMAVPPLAFALTKSAMTHSYHTLEATFRAECDYQPVVGLSKDHRESVAAFLEKRTPHYTGE